MLIPNIRESQAGPGAKLVTALVYHPGLLGGWLGNQADTSRERARPFLRSGTESATVGAFQCAIRAEWTGNFEKTLGEYGNVLRIRR